MQIHEVSKGLETLRCFIEVSNSKSLKAVYKLELGYTSSLNDHISSTIEVLLPSQVYLTPFFTKGVHHHT